MPEHEDSNQNHNMQIAMIGLGRMGANMVRRLLRNSHQCVVFDTNPKAVEELVKEGATGAASLKELVSKLEKPRAVWIMIPAAITDKIVDELAGLMEPGDTIIDGGIPISATTGAAANRCGPKASTTWIAGRAVESGAWSAGIA